MAILRFTGATDGDLSKTTNYQVRSGGSWIAASAIPASGDTIYFTNTSRNVDAGLNQSAINPAKVVISPDYLGKFGSASGSVQYGTITDLQVNSGGPWVFLNATVTTGYVEMSGGRQLYITGGTWTTVFSGSGVINAGTNRVDNIYNDSGVWALGANANDLLVVRNDRGRIQVADRDVRSYVGESGSRLITEGTAKISDGSGGGAASIGPGAVWTSNSDGTHDNTFVQNGGNVDPSRSEYDQTFTNVYRWPGSRFVEYAPGVNITITNPFFIGGGSVGIPLLGSGAGIP